MDSIDIKHVFRDEDLQDYLLRLRKLCKYKLHNHPTEAEEVVSEVLLVFVTAVNNTKIPKDPMAWLYSVANNIIKHKYKEIQREDHRSAYIHSDNELWVYPDFTDEIISDSAILKMADDILSGFTEEERTLLSYIYIENKSMKEIAEIMGKTESAVKQKHYRLCLSIKRLIKEQIENR